jgi:glutamate formiminotransferase
VLECVINISEGRDQSILDALKDAAGFDLLDVHTDSDHNRSVFTVVGHDAPRRLTARAAQLLDMSVHTGVHPRLGAIDVVPFVPLKESTMTDAIKARDAFAQWATEQLHIPCFLYGPERSLPTVRRDAWRTLSPVVPDMPPHPTAGAICVGARQPLIAYNLWLSGVDIDTTKKIAAAVRTDHMRTLGLQVGRFTQVSMNLIEPDIAGPLEAYRAVAVHAEIYAAELVGLVPEQTLMKIPKDKWEALDLSEDRTIEWRLARRVNGD